MDKIRGFESISTMKNIKLPLAGTEDSAGYDFFAIEDVIIPSMISKETLFSLYKELENGNNDFVLENEIAKLAKPVLVPTGIKAYMQKNEVLFLMNRSSGPKKKNLIVPNSVGVIDR